MSKGKVRTEIRALEESKTEILKNYVPREYHSENIIIKENETLFSLEVISKYLVFLCENTIKNKKYNLIEHNNKKHLNTRSIIGMLNDCKHRDNKFRTIDINNELGMVSIFKDYRYISDLHTSLHIVDDDKSEIKYTLESQFLYTVFKYLQYLKHETKEKVFLQDVEFAHPQYTSMKPFRFDLYIPTAKICIEYLEDYHISTPEQIKLDEIRLQVIEHQDIKVMTYDTNQEKEDPMGNLINFLLKLKATIVERSLYFTDKKLTIDQYLYVFEKNGIENINIARKMLEIRENKMEYKLSLEYACETIEIYSDKFELALKTVKIHLDQDQYIYEGEFKVENIYLNASGFCDFCVLTGTKTSKQILHYYRQVEDMCIKMIDDKQEHMIENNRKKKEYEQVVNTFLKKNWTYYQEVDTNMWKKKYDKDITIGMSEIKLMRKKNLKMQRALDKIKDISLKEINLKKYTTEKELTKIKKKLENINKQLEDVSFDKNTNARLENNDIIIPELECLVYKEVINENIDSNPNRYLKYNGIFPIYLSQVTEKYNQYNSTSLSNNQMKEKFSQFADQIQFFTPPTCFGKTNEITITNIKWISDDEFDNNSLSSHESDSDNDSDNDSDLDIDSDNESNSDNKRSIDLIKNLNLEF